MNETNNTLQAVNQTPVGQPQPNALQPQATMNQSPMPGVQAPIEQPGIVNGRIIVLGTDITDISVQELDEDYIDEMTNEQIDLYLENKSEEDKTLFNQKSGVVESEILSEEELNKRQQQRSGFAINLTSNVPNNNSTVAPASQPEIKTEQTGSVIFGVKK